MPSTKAILDAGARLYAALPDAKFTRTTVIELGRCVSEDVKWEDVPGIVKVPLMRAAFKLGMVVEGEIKDAETYEPPTVTPITRDEAREKLGGKLPGDKP